MISPVGARRSVSAHLAAGDRDVTLADKREGRGPVGPIAGDSAAVTSHFAGGKRLQIPLADRRHPLAG